MITDVLDTLLSVAIPQHCMSCGLGECRISGGAACDDCWQTTRVFNGGELLCAKCGAFYATVGERVDVRCHKCDEHAYERAFAAGIYEKALAANLLRLKVDRHIPQMVAATIDAAIDRHRHLSPDLIVPVPLSERRMYERGYNQAEVIAARVGKRFSVPVDAKTLLRRTHTPMHRMAMDRRARELTVIGAFEVVRPKLIDGRRILLVDDIFTSGSTASACAAVLKKKGASEVNVFTIARAVIE